MIINIGNVGMVMQYIKNKNALKGLDACSLVMLPKFQTPAKQLS
jgi:hypothetical protein